MDVANHIRCLGRRRKILHLQGDDTAIPELCNHLKHNGKIISGFIPSIDAAFGVGVGLIEQTYDYIGGQELCYASKHTKEDENDRHLPVQTQLHAKNTPLVRTTRASQISADTTSLVLSGSSDMLPVDIRVRVVELDHDDCTDTYTYAAQQSTIYMVS